MSILNVIVLATAACALGTAICTLLSTLLNGRKLAHMSRKAAESAQDVKAMVNGRLDQLISVLTTQARKEGFEEGLRARDNTRPDHRIQEEPTRVM